MELNFNQAFVPAHGEAVPVARDVLRITVNNPGPFTFHGTNSYVIGRDTLAVIDPGPEDEAHFAALMNAIAGRPVSHIFVSHTHKDHSPLARRLAQTTGATVLAEGPHRSARALNIGEVNPLDASADTEFVPDLALADGQNVDGDGWTIRAIHTPGHTANHLAFALEDRGVLFSADHVMAWATTIVAPPDGAMADFMASVEKLMGREDAIYLPGHGGPVDKPASFLRGLRAHRIMRERAIVERLKAGDRTISEMVKVIYRAIDPRLHGAAALSVLAHLEDLVSRGEVVTDNAPAINGIFAPA